ncbi:type I pullulanase [Neobacillus dielmonensis]|uniref:type I pullulanase n=1 Tax=Neobacillus dielmonensis TaxID=1347369 RepID=UPI0005A9C916|nr:type I pullulanase [Neobacillus dielmonensis]
MIAAERSFLAYLDEMNIITILLPRTIQERISSSFYITDGPMFHSLIVKEQLLIEDYHKFVCEFSGEIYFGRSYWIVDEYGRKTDLQMGAVIRTEAFDQKFYYPGNDLGAVYHPEETCFKVWAPTASQVKLKLRPPDSVYSEIIKMKRGEFGVWSVSVKGDYELYQYSFLVQINQEWRDAVDPYVKAVTVNGESGVIVDLAKTDRPKLPLPSLKNPVDAVIYETHIRDFTIHQDSGVQNKGLYLGAAERNTIGRDGRPTGLSYVKDMGITHLQLLPFHDFAGVDETAWQKQYNWGYNPLHFNAPEGSYSTDPTNPYSRIRELKQMIDQIHQSGLRVIMDVVYNHVFIREESPFEKIVPGYYFRHDEQGLPSNGTGVGNDIASERRMVRKFIVDSIRFWMEEYHIDGFRFDLMGILDVETLNQIRAVCDSISNDVIIIGEGWELDTPLPQDQKATIANQDKLASIAHFNDKFRDLIKGNTFELSAKGYALGNGQSRDGALEVLTGSIGFTGKGNRVFNCPSQSVNYVECHDNHTLWDKLLACFPSMEDNIRQKYHRLATGLVILAQGIPFLHSGQEFFRTKYGEGNSYCSPDRVNQLDWDRKAKFISNVEYVKGLIQIRKAYSCFRLPSADRIQKLITDLSMPDPLLGLLYSEKEAEVILLVNPQSKKQEVSVPAGDWLVLADPVSAGLTPKRTVSGGEMVIEPISLNIFLKK